MCLYDSSLQIVMDNSQVEDAFSVIETSIAEIKWKLRPSSKNRLVLDIFALTTGLRPAVMVDYGGHGSELQAHLCVLLDLIKKQSSTFEPLRVMIIEDMIYIIHIRGLAEHALASLCLKRELLFVDIDRDPPKMLLQKDGHVVSSQLESIQKMIFSLLCDHELNKDLLVDIPSCLAIGPPERVLVEQSSYQKSSANELSGLIDLSSVMQESQVTLPTLNGWLLGYPVVYLFSKDHVADAISNLSSKSLHLYMILVCRNVVSKKENFQELMSKKEDKRRPLCKFSIMQERSMGFSINKMFHGIHGLTRGPSWIRLSLGVVYMAPEG